MTWVFEHGTLYQFPRVVHYAGKKNGGIGWEDTYQNVLIDRLLSSRWMKPERQGLEY